MKALLPPRFSVCFRWLLLPQTHLPSAVGIYASPVLAGGVLYIASTDGSVYALI